MWEMGCRRKIDTSYSGRKGIPSNKQSFFNAPFGVDYHMYNTSEDLMHTFLCGIIKPVLQWTLIILLDISHHHVGENRFFPYKKIKAYLTNDLEHFQRKFPTVPHLYWNTFKSALP